MKSQRNWLNFLRPAGTCILLLCVLLSLSPQASLAETKASRISFPEIEGWVRAPSIQVYMPDNLFDYIDGAADLYLSYHFRELRVAEYRDRRGDLVAVEIYRHSTPVDAFGIYSQEQPPDPFILDIGTRCYIQDTVLNLLAGRYYIKILAYQKGFNTQEILRRFANRVAENLEIGDPEAESELARILACFPQERKRSYSEQYVAENFLGYAFLSSGFTAEYADSIVAFKLFIIATKDSADCQRMLEEYLQATKYPQAEAKEGGYIISDPYHGEVALSWRGQYIRGVLDLTQADLRDEYLSLTEELLIKNGLIEP